MIRVWIGIWLRKALPLQPLPREFVLLCEVLDVAGLPPAPDLASPGLPQPQS